MKHTPQGAELKMGGEQVLVAGGALGLATSEGSLVM